MVRLFAGLIGAFFVFMLVWALGDGIYKAATTDVEETAEHAFHKKPRDVSFAHDGPFGKFDRAQLQRGLKVYKEVCAACHSMNLVAFRNFEDIGYNEDEVKAIAKGWLIETPSIDPETGEATTRPSLPSDQIPSPHANEIAARAANAGALPPDLSLITKARANGTAYVYSLLMGYEGQPEALKEFPDVAAGSGPDPRDPEKAPGTLHYNPYFANLNIAMASPLSGDDMVTYDDGTEATRDQMAKDVSAFLHWTAEPKMENRKMAGWAALIFLIIFSVLTYMSYKSIWADKKH